MSSLDGAVRRISTSLLDVQPAALGDAISSAIGEVCQALDVDRGYVLTTNPETLSVGVLEEWWRPGIERVNATPIPELPIEAQRFWVRRLRNNDPVHFDDVEEVPEEAEPAAADLIATGVRSILLVPLNSSKGTLGFTGFEARRHHHEWTEDEIADIRTIGEMFVITIDRCAAETALQQTAADLEQRNIDLERSNRDLEQFASIVSHDLQSPLMLVQGYLELVVKTLGDPAAAESARQYAATAKRGLDRMSALIHDLLSYARAGAGLTEREPVVLDEVVAEVLDELQPALSAANGTVDVGPLPTVRGDRWQLRQVFQNVVGNAIKFHRPDRAASVSVRAERVGPCWRVVVADDGIGIDADRAAEVFEMFKRGSRAETPGAGIGLAIASRVVANHEGHIWAEPNEGGGTRLCIELPVDPAGGSGG